MTCVAGQKMVRTELKSYGASHVGGMTAVQLKKLISAVLDGRSEAKKARIEESNVDSKPALNTPADRARHYLGRACSACNRAPAWAQMMAVMIARELVRAGTGY